MEKERGISVTSSVMQFPYRDAVVNLLDTPGHEDFSEDTYRTLTAVDSALMVIDVAKGVEERTIKLMEVCRLRDTPSSPSSTSWTARAEPWSCWTRWRRCSDPLRPHHLAHRHGQALQGGLRPAQRSTCISSAGPEWRQAEGDRHPGPRQSALDELLGDQAEELRDEIELVQGASHPSILEAYRAGELTPVFFGSAINNFGVQELLDAFVEYAPPSRAAR
jgi:peptide chain release factor 3